jgi:P-type Ca2+ transporter type 2C
VLMITGDHPATAKAVGEVIGIKTQRVVTGADIERMPSEQLRELVRHINIFARVAPEHKLRLVKALKANGEVVAMTGDGVNDAPVLKRSDVGVAMGQRGATSHGKCPMLYCWMTTSPRLSRLSRKSQHLREHPEVHSLLLFHRSGIHRAHDCRSRPGLRARYQGPSRRYVSAATDGRPLKLRINVVADGPPALALAFDRNPGVMSKPPRPPTSRPLDAASLRFIVISGTAKAIGGVGFLAAMPQLRALLGLVPAGAPIFAAIAVAVLFTWAIAAFLELSGRQY